MAGGEKPKGAPEEPNIPRWRRWILPVGLALAFWGAQVYGDRADARPEIGYSTFYALLEGETVERVTLTGPVVTGSLKADREVDGKKLREFSARLPAQDDPTLLPLLRERGVAVQVKSEEPPLAVRVLTQILPWVLILGAWMWISRKAQGAMGAGGIFGGAMKGRSRRFSEQTDVKVSFDDVAGLTSAKRDLREVVDLLKEPERFRALGAHVPRGVLLVGPPGTGKTLLARAVAGEAGVPFFSINGSEFVELFVGVGASRVRELFEAAKKVAPAIVFIDELDAVGRARGVGLAAGHDEREQTLNQLLSEIDGFSRNDLTIVLAATNRPDVLDAALLRPGRFDRRVLVDRPERAARRAILEVHTRGKPLGDDVDLDALAGATPGASGADLANLVNEAALVATRGGGSVISAEDFWKAQEKIEIGDPREGPLSPEEKGRVAVHEAGHALAAHRTEGAEPVRRVSIIPRGMALGVTTQLPAADKHIFTRSQLEAKLRVLLGGFAAETLVFGEASTGAQNDLRQATEIAHDMVAHYGMSEALGPVFYEQRAQQGFLGGRGGGDGGMSEATARQIELEVQRTLAEQLAATRAMLTAARPTLDRLSATLLERETLDGEELATALAGAEQETAAPATNAPKRAAPDAAATAE